MRPLPPRTQTALFALLRPRMQNFEERQAILRLAGLPEDHNLQLAGPTETVMANLVPQLRARGDLGTGKPALCVLLEEIAKRAGLDVAARARQLASEIAYLHAEPQIAAYCEERVDALASIFQQYADPSGLDQSPLPTAPPQITRSIPVERHNRFAEEVADLIGRREWNDLAQRVQPQPLLALTGEYTPRDEQRREAVDNVRKRLLHVEHGVLLGEPGSGKSWTLLRLVYDYAARWLADDQDDGDAPSRHPLPVLVRLNNFTGGTSDAPQDIAAFVQASLGPLGEFLPQLLAERRLVFLCDALNELPRGPEGRDLVAELRAYLADKPRFLVSCRVRDYQNDLAALHPLEQLRLLDLELPAIKDAILRRLDDERGPALWVAIGGTAALEHFYQVARAKGEESKFWESDANLSWYQWSDQRGNVYQGYQDWQQMHRGAALIPLCRTPYLLGMVCKIYKESQGLPESRGQLFHGFVETLLLREQASASRTGRSWPDQEQTMAALEALATALQQRKGTTLTATEATVAIPLAEPTTFLNAAQSANLLALDGERWRFTHQLLQEYFAARVLLHALESDPPAAAVLSGDWWERGTWRETVAILCDLLQHTGGGPATFSRVAAWLAPQSPELALDLLRENAAPSDLAALRDLLIESAQGRIAESHPMGRAAAYRVLGVLDGDDRPGIGVHNGVPDLQWCQIPGGTAGIGGDSAAYNPLPRQEIPLASYWIAQYPVTNAQFNAFVEAEDGYQNARWWKGLTRPDEPRPGTFPEGNHPQVMVDWYEATAYCRWLQAHRDQLALPPAVPPEYVVRLPTEAEWEWAARWPDGRVYPWGAEFDPARANTAETGIGRTSAVGIFPDGRAPCGAYGLSGNVFEWTLSEYETRGSRILLDLLRRFLRRQPNTAPRVLRGGSWYDLSAYARAASRVRFNPYLRNYSFGFRVVVSSPIH